MDGLSTLHRCTRELVTSPSDGKLPLRVLHIYLVGGFNSSEKYESQLGLLFPIYGKIKKMFRTTNQLYLTLLHTFFSLFLSLSYYSHFDDMMTWSFRFFFNPVFNPHLLPLHRQWFFCLHRHDLTGGLAASSKNTTYKRRQLGMDLFMRTRGISKQWGMLSMGSFNDILSISLESLELIIETWLIRIKVIFHGARHTLW